jgi:hypothetical protein
VHAWRGSNLSMPFLSHGVSVSVARLVRKFESAQHGGVSPNQIFSADAGLPGRAFPAPANPSRSCLARRASFKKKPTALKPRA